MIDGLFELLRSDGSIVINKKLMNKIGLHESILYSELISRYLYFKNKNKLTVDGFFFNTVEDLKEGTTLSKSQQLKAIKSLQNLSLIECKLKGVPAVRHFKPNLDIKIILSLLGKTEVKKSCVIDKHQEEPDIKPDSNMEQNKVLSSKESISHKEFFEKAWKYLLNIDKTKGTRLRQGKSSIKATQQKKLQKVGHEILEQCLELYLKQNIESKYYMLGSTWFNGRYEDFIDEAKKLVSEGIEVKPLNKTKKQSAEDLIWG